MNKLKIIIYLLTITMITLLTTECPVPSGKSSGGHHKSSGTSFWARKADGTDQFYQVNASLQYTGTYCLIYVDNKSLASVSTATAAAIGNEFDNNIYLKDKNYFGADSDVDGNGKIIILILDIIDGFSGSGGYVAGYFDAIHLYSKSTYSVSNEADMVFMDCYPGTPGDSTFYLTIAHEFQHLINYNVNVFLESGNPQDTWINEGLSSAAETIYNGINNDKVNYYNTNSSVKNGTYFVKWTNDLANYSTVYLFFQWLRIQASNGNNIFKKINYDLDNDYKAVQDAAKTYITTSIYSYDGTTGWKNIFRDWLIANYCCDPAGLYGYKGSISVTPQNFTTAGVKSLGPGGAVYKHISGSFTGSPSGNIDYVGLTDSSSIDVLNDPSYNGDYLIAFNANPNDSGSSENTASLPATPSVLSASKINLNLAITNSEEKKVYPMDFTFNPEDK